MMPRASFTFSEADEGSVGAAEAAAVALTAERGRPLSEGRTGAVEAWRWWGGKVETTVSEAGGLLLQRRFK